MKSDKTGKLLELLAAQVAKEDPNVLKKPKRLKKAFQLAAGSLKDEKLKQKILKNFDDCFTDLQRIIQEQLRNAQSQKQKTPSHKEKESTTSVENGHVQKTKFIYNLYCKKGRSIDEEHLKKLDKSTQRTLYCMYLRCVLPGAEDEEQLLDIASKCKKAGTDGPESWIAAMTELCTSLHGDMNTSSLRLIMNIFNRKYAEAAETTTKTKRLQQLISQGQHFIKTFHFHYCTLKKEFDGRPKYEDYLAGILATYTDLCLTLHHSSPEACLVSGRHLCSFILRLLGNHKHYGYDLILQLEKVQSGDGPIIVPLARCLLENIPTMMSCVLYMKYVLSARCITHLIPDGTETIKQKAASVRPPPSLKSWLENNNPSILDEFPVTKHFKGAKITRFLLDEADDNTVQLLIDLLGESCDEDGMEANGTEEVQQSEADVVNVDMADLFVIDKTPDAKAASDMKDQFGLQDDADDDQLLHVVQINDNAPNNSETEAQLDSDDYTESDTEPIRVNNIVFEILTQEEASKLTLAEKTSMALSQISQVGKESSDEELGERCSGGEEQVNEIVSSDEDLDLAEGASGEEQEEMESGSDEQEEIMSSDEEHTQMQSKKRGRIISSDEASKFENEEMSEGDKEDEEGEEGEDEVDLVSDMEESSEEEGSDTDMDDVVIEIVDKDEEDARVKSNHAESATSGSVPRKLEKMKSDFRNIVNPSEPSETGSEMKQQEVDMEDDCVLIEDLDHVANDISNDQEPEGPRKNSDQEMINRSPKKSQRQHALSPSIRSIGYGSPKSSGTERSDTSSGESPMNKRISSDSPRGMKKAIALNEVAVSTAKKCDSVLPTDLSVQSEVKWKNAVRSPVVSPVKNGNEVESNKESSNESPLKKKTIDSSPKKRQAAEGNTDEFNMSLRKKKAVDVSDTSTNESANESPITKKMIANSNLSPRKRQTVKATSDLCNISLEEKSSVDVSDTSTSEASPRKREKVEFSDSPDINIVTVSPFKSKERMKPQQIQNPTILEFQSETAFQSDVSDGYESPCKSVHKSKSTPSDSDFVPDSSESAEESLKAGRHLVIMNRMLLNLPGMSPRTRSHDKSAVDTSQSLTKQTSQLSPRNAIPKSPTKAKTILLSPRNTVPQSPSKTQAQTPSPRSQTACAASEATPSSPRKIIAKSPTKAENVSQSLRTSNTDIKLSPEKPTRHGGAKNSPRKSLGSSLSGLCTDSDFETSPRKLRPSKILSGAERDRPVSRRLDQLKAEGGGRSRRRTTASGDELAATLRLVKAEEKDASTKTNARRRSMPVPRVDSDNDDDTPVVRRTPRKAAVKANEMFTAICSPRKRRDSQMSVDSNTEDGSALVTRSRKRTDSEVSTQSTGDHPADLATGITTPKKKSTVDVSGKSRRMSVPFHMMTTPEAKVGSDGKTPPRIASAKKGYSLRTPSKLVGDEK